MWKLFHIARINGVYENKGIDYLQEHDRSGSSVLEFFKSVNHNVKQWL